MVIRGQDAWNNRPGQEKSEEGVADESAPPIKTGREQETSVGET